MTTNVPASVATLLEKADCFGPLTDEFVSGIERQHGLTFPSEYRAFLLRYGAALLPALEVYGLVPTYGDGEPPIWNDLRAGLERRIDGLSANLVPICDDGCDLKFYLSCDDGSAFGTVLIYGPGFDGERVSSGFFEFLARASSHGISSLKPT